MTLLNAPDSTVEAIARRRCHGTYQGLWRYFRASDARGLLHEEMINAGELTHVL